MMAKHNMKNLSRRGLSLLMAMVMTLSLLQISAFASGYSNQVMDGYYVIDEHGHVMENGEKKVVSEAANTVDGYTLSKTLNQTGENAFDVTLKVVTQQTVTTNDAAVCLVIDTSGSMDYCATCGSSYNHKDGWACDKNPNDRWTSKVEYDETRMAAAIAEAKAFIDALQSGLQGSAGIYVSVVRFSGYNQPSASVLVNWAKVTHDSDPISSYLTSTNLYASGGTNTEAGLLLARNLFNQNAVSSVALSNRYTVLLTDGQPTARCTSDHTTLDTITDYAEGSGMNAGSTTNENEYNETIAAATAVKAKSKLYTICFGVADDEMYELDAADGKCDRCGAKQADHRIVIKNEKTRYYCYDNSNDYRFSDEKTNVTVGDYLKNSIATPAAAGIQYAYNASNAEDVHTAFANIATASASGANGAGTAVTDPMGQNITLVTNFAGDDAVAVNGSTMRWTLDPDDAQKNTSGSTTTYTYTKTYSITLNTAAEGFAENVYYPTNGYTYLAVDNEKLPFHIPAVKGTVPSVGYTVEYYKWDKQTESYPTAATKTDTVRDAKLWTTVYAPNGYATKYNADGYVFDRGDTSMQITADGMVMELYYKPVAVNVTVNQYAVTTTQTDAGEVVSGPTLIKTNNYPAQDGSQQYYKGDSFSFPADQLLSSAAYTKVASVAVDGTTYTTDSYNNVALTGNTTINIYYTNTVEDRTSVDYEVHYFYRTNSWTLNEDGKYELTDGTYAEDATKKITGNDFLNASYTAPAKADGFGLDKVTFNGADNDSYTVTLVGGANVINVYYEKDGTAPETATLNIIHKYYDRTINGDQLVEDLTWTERENQSVYVGETWYVERVDTKSGAYQLSNPNALSVEITEAGKTYEIVAVYVRDLRQPAEVVLNHYYTAYVYAINSATGDGQWVEDTTHQNPQNIENFRDTSATWYAGMKYTAQQIPNGYTLNADLSDAAETELTSGTNTFDLYYETYIGDEDVADVTVNHIYETYTSYVDENGVVVRNEKTFSTVNEDPYYGAPGDTFTAELRNEEGFTFDHADTADRKVTLVGDDGQYNLYYKKTVNNLGDPVSVTVQPIYKTYTTSIVGGVSKTELTDTQRPTAVALEGEYYLDQKVSVIPSVYAPLANTGLTYDAADTDNTAGHQITVAADGNVIYVVFSKTVDARVPAAVTIRDHYFFLTKTSDENGVYGEDPFSITITGTTYTSSKDGYYQGMSFDTTGKGTQKDGYDVDTREGIVQPATSIELTEDLTYVDFYWYGESDQTNPATVQTIHHYTIHDAHPGVADRTWTVGDTAEDVLAGHYAGEHYVASFNFADDAFNSSHVTEVTPSDATSADGTVLTRGANVIHIYYEKTIDTRSQTTAKVIHNYYHDADALAAGTTESIYEENPTVRETDSYTATLRNQATGGIVYDYASSTPANYTIDVKKDAESNVITISYVRAEAGYTVVHEYYTDGSQTGRVTSASVAGKVGDTVTAAAIAKLPTFEGNSYAFSAEQSDVSIDLKAGNDNAIVLRYYRTTPPPTTGGDDPTTTYYYQVTTNYTAYDADGSVLYTDSVVGSVQSTTSGSYTLTSAESASRAGYTFALTSDASQSAGLAGTSRANPYQFTVEYEYTAVSLDDEDVPGSDLPVQPDEPTEIPEDDVPMAEAPATGDSLAAWIMAAAVSGIGLVWMAIAGKKRKDEQA